MRKDARIFVAGHQGLAGGAIVRALSAQGYSNLLLRGRKELDLTEQRAVETFFAEHKPDCVFLAAAKVGGIHANDTYPAEFIRDNLMIQTNVIHAAWSHGAEKLVFLGSSCIYPKLAAQPMKETELLTGPLEPTNEWYAVAKIAGIKQCQAYRRQYGFNAISLMPTNLYGPGDNFHPQNSHVLPALIRRFHEAREAQLEQVVIWGSGTPRREFLYIEDFADAALHLMQHYDGEDIVNIGVGSDVTILELAQLVAEVVGYRGRIANDPGKPDGTPRKLMDVERLNGLGWKARTPLREGIAATYQWFFSNQGRYRA